MPEPTSPEMSRQEQQISSYSQAVPNYESAIGRGKGTLPNFGDKTNFEINDPLTGKPPEHDPRRDTEAYMRQRSTRESLNDELLGSAKSPFELFFGMRRIFKRLESGTIPPSLAENFRPPSQLTGMIERQEDLAMTGEDLVNIGFLTHYDPETGLGIPTDPKFSIMGMSTTAFAVNAGSSSGEVKYAKENGPNVEAGYNFGTPEKRSELASAYERAEHEMEARAIIGEWMGVMMNLNIRDNLEGLVNWEHGTTAKLKAEHLKAIFNMPNLNEMKTNPENHTLGDQIEEAVVLNLIMLNSGNKDRMKDFLKRPGVQHLISKIAKEEEHRRGKPLTRDQWIKEYIGDVDSWVNDYDPTIQVYDEETKTGDKEYYKKTRDLGKTWRVEAVDGRRGKLTKWGNIAAFGGNAGEFDEKKEKIFIEEDIGGTVGSVEASWIAVALLRGMGTYASEGYVALPNGKSLLTLGEGNRISSDDRGKLHTYMFNYKEGVKNRPHGLRGLLGKVPDTAFDLFDWGQVDMPDLPKNSDGTFQKRSIWDAWLGTAKDIPIKNLLTQEPTGELTREESYHRLGSIDFHSMPSDFHGTFGIMQWLLGREGDGVYTNAMNVEKFGPNDFTLNALWKINKYIGICFNPIILTKGSQHLYDGVIPSMFTIQKNFLRNLMLARIHSAHFSLNILNGERKMFNAQGKDVDVPEPILIRQNIRDVLAKPPEDYEALLANYRDENFDLRTLGSGKTPGLNTDVSDFILNEKFAPEDMDEKQKTKYVGKVLGMASK